jgi:hypothetical protein
MKNESATMRELKQIFLRAFKVIDLDEKKPNLSFERWLLDVRHFNIRKYLQKYDFLFLLSLIPNMKEK